MQPVLAIVAGALAFATTVWVVHRIVRRAFPAATPNVIGAGLIAAAIWLLAFRAIAVALVLLLLGAIMLAPGATTSPGTRSPRISRVRSAHLEMTLDHDSGEIDGLILSGSHEGQMLSQLTLPELLQLLPEMTSDTQSVKLLETYLDRAHPEWHEHADRSAHDRETPPPGASDMSRDEACRILGLEPDPTEDDVREAYRRLVKRLHPDSGGSAVLMAQITAARDRLLGGS